MKASSSGSDSSEVEALKQINLVEDMIKLFVADAQFGASTEALEYLAIASAKRTRVEQKSERARSDAAMKKSTGS